jgi:hypothetical protein
MILIPNRNRASLSFENDLNSRINKESCELRMKDSAFEWI